MKTRWRDTTKTNTHHTFWFHSITQLYFACLWLTEQLFTIFRANEKNQNQSNRAFNFASHLKTALQQVNLPIAYNNCIEVVNLSLIGIKISDQNFPNFLVCSFLTDERADPTDKWVEIDILLQVKLGSIIFKIFKNFLMTDIRWPLWGKWKVWKCHHFFRKIGPETETMDCIMFNIKDVQVQ